MEYDLSSIAQKLIEDFKNLAKTETVIGEPFQMGEYTCMPVIKVGIGYGSGGGSGSGKAKNEQSGSGGGGGVGGGIGVEPIAFLCSRGDQITLLNVGKGEGITSFFDKIPGVVEKFMDIKKKQKEDKEESD